MARKMIALFMVMIGLLGTFLMSSAGATTPSDIQVTINGTPSADPTVFNNGGADPTKSWVNIAGNYTFGNAPNTYTITIAPKCTTGATPDNLARIEAGNDSQDDVLALKNVRITISSIPSPAPEHLISFTATFKNPPSTDRTQNPELRSAYRIDGSQNGNNITRNGFPAKDDTVRARGSVEFPKTSGTWWPIQDSTNIELSRTITSNDARFFPTGGFQIDRNWDSSTSPVDLNGDRTLKGEFWFKITNTSDILSIPLNCATAGLVQVKSIPAFIPPQRQGVKDEMGGTHR